MTEQEREQVIRQELHALLQRLSADRAPIDLVDDVTILEDFVDDFGQARIADARAMGASWAEIAQRLGVSRQAAHKRFSGWRRRSRGIGPIIELRFTRDPNDKN